MKSEVFLLSYVWVMAPCSLVGSTNVSEEHAYVVCQQIRGDAEAAIWIVRSEHWIVSRLQHAELVICLVQNIFTWTD